MHSAGTRWMCTILQTLSRVCMKGAGHETIYYSGVILFYRLLLSVDRRKSIEDAKETVELAEACMKNPGGHKAKVVGIDLSGDPSVSGKVLYKSCYSEGFLGNCIECMLMRDGFHPIMDILVSIIGE